MNNNETMKNRFMERYTQAVTAIGIFKEGIDMLETIKEGADKVKTVETFLEANANSNISIPEFNEMKDVLAEYLSDQRTHVETLAYLNHLHDITYYKASNMLLMQDVFKCYF